VNEPPWYAQLREEYQPETIRVLLIGESAPDAGASEKRFFYAPVLDRRDNLFRAVVAAFLGCSPGKSGDSKQPHLERLKAEGVYLIDLVPFPVNKLEAKARAKALRDHATSCIDAARLLNPAGIIVCHTPSYHVLAKPMADAKLPLLHSAPIPFPLGNWRPKFIADVRAALKRARLSAL